MQTAVSPTAPVTPPTSMWQTFKLNCQICWFNSGPANRTPPPPPSRRIEMSSTPSPPQAEISLQSPPSRSSMETIVI